MARHTHPPACTSAGSGSPSPRPPHTPLPERKRYGILLQSQRDTSCWSNPPEILCRLITPGHNSQGSRRDNTNRPHKISTFRAPGHKRCTRHPTPRAHPLNAHNGTRIPWHRPRTTGRGNTKAAKSDVDRMGHPPRFRITPETCDRTDDVWRTSRTKTPSQDAPVMRVSGTRHTQPQTSGHRALPPPAGEPDAPPHGARTNRHRTCAHGERNT
jgi:hypothetical protein